ncbi:MAG: hypothetical protein QGH13_03935, partial [Candidatus Thalassarchaeaceae archaeon]|nr:hypothetical protein [Candidatus Thalassarchaeaceae archaeon]
MNRPKSNWAEMGILAATLAQNRTHSKMLHNQHLQTVMLQQQQQYLSAQRECRRKLYLIDDEVNDIGNQNNFVEFRCAQLKQIQSEVESFRQYLDSHEDLEKMNKLTKRINSKLNDLQNQFSSDSNYIVDILVTADYFSSYFKRRKKELKRTQKKREKSSTYLKVSFGFLLVFMLIGWTVTGLTATYETTIPIWGIGFSFLGSFPLICSYLFF